jgi:hypothetical protein
MIYDNLMNAGSLPSRDFSPSAPMDHERSGKLESRSAREKDDRARSSEVKVTFRNGEFQVTAVAAG